MKEKFKFKKNCILRLSAALLFGMIMMMAVSTESYAAPKQMPDGTVFDADFYAATYPDVAAVLGTDETIFYNHYVLCGKAEGRLPYDAKVARELKNQENYNKLMALKEIYPDGTPWDINTSYVLNQDRKFYYSGEKFSAGEEVTACYGFVCMFQENVLGTEKSVNKHDTGLRKWANENADGKWRASDKTDWIYVPKGYTGQDPVVNGKFEEYWEKLQVGDIINDVGHSMMVLTKGEDHITIVEANYGAPAVEWGRRIDKEILRLSLCTIETSAW